MTLMTFLGCTCIAFGPSLALFAFTISKDPIRVILFVVGCFFWLISLLFSALMWLAVVPLQDQLAFSLVFSVVFQELFRFALYKLMSKAEEGLADTLSEVERNAITGHKLSYVLGFGFGTMEGLFSVVNILNHSYGPGNIGISHGPENFFLVSAFLANCYILLNVAWNVVVFSTLKKQQYILYAALPCLHMLTSCITLFNSSSSYNFLSVIAAYVVLVISMAWAFKVAGGSMLSAKAFFSVSRVRP